VTGVHTLGMLTTAPAAERPELLAPAVRDALFSLGLAAVVGVVEIDPDLSDTAATKEAYGLETETLANCVIVTGRREGEERSAACLVPATTRADINGFVKRHLDVRKASFMPREIAVQLTGMEFGGITPIGLPETLPVLVDARVIRTQLVIVGSGIRRSKLIVPGELFASLPGVQVVEGLSRETPVEA
jgi:prolyl-tRNA editing enzyme YbaK/EbsC (Cys-tRNA(Pro) deacylase)